MRLNGTSSTNSPVNVKSTALLVRPFVPKFASRSRIVDADGHRPAFRAQHPLLDKFRLNMGAIDGLRRSIETACTNDMSVALSFQCQFAHRRAFRFLGFIPANTSS